MMRSAHCAATLVATACLAFAPFALAQTPAGRPAGPATIPASELRVLPKPVPDDSLPRTLSVALPRDYAEPGKRYGVVYVLDADGLFPMVSDIARVLELGGEMPGVIVVGLGYGRPYMQTLGARTRDLTPTAMASRPGSGGAARFLRYLTSEVMPHVDSVYRTIPRDRTLVGHSLGGTFALFAMFEAPGTFRRLVIGSPSGWDGAWLARRDSSHAPAAEPAPMAVFLSVGGQEGLASLSSWRRTVDLLARDKYAHVLLTSEILGAESHISAMPVATTHGLKAVFAREP